MKKVIIVDDRLERMKLHLSTESLTDLKSLVEDGILMISTEISSEKDGINSVFIDYDIIAVHRSYLANTSMSNSFNEYVKRSNKYFIVFSGGISQSILSNKGHLLNINSSDFYTPELPRFIKKFCSDNGIESPLLQYLYGDSWRLTLLLQYRHLLWTYGDIDDIDDDMDENMAEELHDILWGGDINVSMKDINAEIEIEKERRINL